MGAVVTEPVAIARVAQGWWVADCPRPFCAGAEHAGRRDGNVGGLTGAGFRCANCGLLCASRWPGNIEDIERLLLQRPVPQTRNWSPGESLADLLAENLEHGVLPAVPASLDPGDPGLLVAVAGDRITNDRALPAGHRLALGGH